jgi:hypothetical protein
MEPERGETDNAPKNLRGLSETRAFGTHQQYDRIDAAEV